MRSRRGGASGQVIYEKLFAWLVSCINTCLSESDALSQLDRWHAQCDAAGIHPDAAYADSTALPVAPGSCTLLLDEPSLYVSRADGLPFVLDATPLGAALDLVIAEPGAAGEASEHVTFYTTPTEYERHRGVIEGLRTRTATLQV
jgi:hypothetical protein